MTYTFRLIRFVLVIIALGGYEHLSGVSAILPSADRYCPGWSLGRA